jgi:hypothetical protein
MCRLLDSLDGSTKKAVIKRKPPTHIKMILPSIPSLMKDHQNIKTSEVLMKDHQNINTSSPNMKHLDGGKKYEDIPSDHQNIKTSPPNMKHLDVGKKYEDIPTPALSPKHFVSDTDTKSGVNTGSSATLISKTLQADLGPNLSRSCSPESEGDLGVAAQLQSSDDTSKLRGYYNLLNIVQEHSLLANTGQIVFEEGVNVIRDLVIRLYSSQNVELLLAVVDFDYMQILLEGGIITLDMIFLPFILIYVTPGQSQPILDQIKSFFDFINGKTSHDILELLFEALRPAKQRIEMRVKKTFSMREILRLSNELLLNWILEICNSNNDGTLLFFQKDTNVRNAVHTLCPVISLKNTKDNSKDTILSILSTIYNQQAQVFLKTLDTVDFEINTLIKK